VIDVAEYLSRHQLLQQALEDGALQRAWA